MTGTIPSKPLTKFEIGWLAGIIEGEGSIANYISNYTLHIRRGKPVNQKRTGRILGVVIVNTDLGILQNVCEILDKMGIAVTRIRQKSSSKKQRVGSYMFTRPCYEIDIRRRLDLQKLLEYVKPYIYGEKKEKVEKLLDYLKNNPIKFIKPYVKGCVETERKALDNKMKLQSVLNSNIKREAEMASPATSE